MSEVNLNPELKGVDEPEETPVPGAIFSQQGTPFKTEGVARSVIAKKKLDPNQFKIQSFEEGFIIVPKSETVKERYFKVVFGHKTSPSDDEDVTLTVNGETLVIARGKDVIIPTRFKECADHTQYPQFRQLPNQPRKIVGHILTFPYSLLGEASAREYFTQLKEGNKKTKEALEANKKLLDA